MSLRPPLCVRGFEFCMRSLEPLQPQTTSPGNSHGGRKWPVLEVTVAIERSFCKPRVEGKEDRERV
jgi:hypothetical protein